MKDQTPEQREIDRIRELLDVAAPRNPETAGRADAVSKRGRRTRTRRGVLSGVAVAAVAATVIVGPHFLKSSPTTNEATDPTNGVDSVAPAATDPFADPCSKQDGLFDGPVDKSAIRADATSIRLCPVMLSGMPTDQWRPPQDALVETADFFAAIADLKAAEPARCAAATPAPDPLYFQVGYPDGSVEQAFSPNACGDIDVDGTPYAVDDVLKAFGDGLAAQRHTLTPPPLAEPECPQPPADSTLGRLEPAPDTWQLGDPLKGVAAGVICYLADPWGSTVYENTEGQLNESQLETILGDIEAHSTDTPAREGGCTDTGPSRVLVLVDGWGDQTSLADVICMDEFAGAVGYWQPSSAAEAAIADALGGAISEHN